MFVREETLALALWFLGAAASQIRCMGKLLGDVVGILVSDKKKLNEVEIVWWLFSELLNMKWVFRIIVNIS